MVESPPTLEQFTGITLASATDLDVARMNLMSGRGLPGTENVDVEALLGRLDDWAEQVRFEICRHLYRFDPRTSEPLTEFNYGNSLGRFFCWYMLQVLQEDCGVAYHPDRKFKPDFCEPRDLFIHGIVDPDGKGGTCASMPVVYVAVARRLGFPVYLVGTRGHLFFRWDDSQGTLIQWKNPDLKLWVPPDRFNVEGAGEGIAYYPDAHYIQWPELWTEIDFDHGRYLRSLTPQEELASFLIQRAECFYDLHNLDEALKAIYYARQLCPDDKRYQQLHARRSKEHYDRQATLAHIEEMEQDRRRRQKMLDGLQSHPVYCPCSECAKAINGSFKSMFPSHSLDCQCRNCRHDRETSAASAGMSGHPPHCLCSLCQQSKLFNPQPASEARPGQLPHQVPGGTWPHHATFRQPQPRGLPGY